MYGSGGLKGCNSFDNTSLERMISNLSTFALGASDHLGMCQLPCLTRAERLARQTGASILPQLHGNYSSHMGHSHSIKAFTCESAVDDMACANLTICVETKLPVVGRLGWWGPLTSARESIHRSAAQKPKWRTRAHHTIAMRASSGPCSCRTKGAWNACD